MTPAELVAFGIARHGKKGWYRKLGKEIHFSGSQVHRASQGTEPISRRMEPEIQALVAQEKDQDKPGL